MCSLLFLLFVFLFLPFFLCYYSELTAVAQARAVAREPPLAVSAHKIWPPAANGTAGILAWLVTTTKDE